VNSLINVTAIAAGGGHTLALKNDGTLWGWGHNQYGQLGNGTTVNSLTPVPLNSITGVIKITAGYDNSLVVKNDGTTWTWGGHGNVTDTSSTPVLINGLCGLSTSVSETEEESEITIFPNPANQLITVSITTPKAKESFNLKINNSLGETVYTTDLREVSGSFTKQIDLSMLPKGIYFVELQSSVYNAKSAKTTTKKIILQ
jgi:alpha-tubulin suppressor-like RCC1 family protein